MDTLVNIRFAFHRNLPILVGICLCLYFSYHSVSGQRSYSRLSQLTSSLQQKTDILYALKQEHGEVESKVVMMRPSSLSIDMLEEQVRSVLGYSNGSEIIVLEN